MYINNEERKAKIGIVSLSASRDNSIKLRFTYPKKKRNDINVATNTDEGWIKALRIAQLINTDIELGQFDPTLILLAHSKNTIKSVRHLPKNLIILPEYQ